MQNISKEDYLSIIYKNKDLNGEVRPNLIAEKLSISAAAVTDMFKKMSKEGLIKYKKYRAITLTDSGDTYAKLIIRRHRLWEMFLYQIVGLPWDKIHDEANNLEHSSSDYLIDRLEELLSFPEYDPHGDPIPSRKGKIPKVKKNIPLSNLNEGDIANVVRVNDFDRNFLTYISQLGIKLSVPITMKQKRAFDKSMEIEINGKSWDISYNLAQNVFVELK
jgi:DtxR family transcriptional regulator, Mn-dependent transcriptional regulator